MARWKLMAPHYLNVPGEEWEYQETNRKTGRPIRTKFKVPRLLDPKDPTCWTNTWGKSDDADGECVVCWAGQGLDNDIIFEGNPTPDMMPVDDEAKAVSAKFESIWNARPEDVSGEYSQSLVDKFQLQLAEASAKPQTVEVAGLSDLVAAIGKLIETPSVNRRPV